MLKNFYKKSNWIINKSHSGISITKNKLLNIKTYTFTSIDVGRNCLCQLRKLCEIQSWRWTLNLQNWYHDSSPQMSVCKWRRKQNHQLLSTLRLIKTRHFLVTDEVKMAKMGSTQTKSFPKLNKFIHQVWSWWICFFFAIMVVNTTWMDRQMQWIMLTIPTPHPIFLNENN